MFDFWKFNNYWNTWWSKVCNVIFLLKFKIAVSFTMWQSFMFFISFIYLCSLLLSVLHFVCVFVSVVLTTMAKCFERLSWFFTWTFLIPRPSYVCIQCFSFSYLINKNRNRTVSLSLSFYPNPVCGSTTSRIEKIMLLCWYQIWCCVKFFL